MKNVWIFRKIKVRTRIALLLAILLMISSLLTGGLLRGYIRSRAQDRMYRYLLSTQKQAVNGIELFLDDVIMLSLRVRMNQELYRIQSAVGLSGYLSLNAGADSDRISLSAMLTATELFTCEGIRENTVFHYLYVFQEGLPIIVTYRTGRDGAVWASGKLLYDKGLNLTSAAELKAYMEETYKTLRDLTVERVH